MPYGGVSGRFGSGWGNPNYSAGGGSSWGRPDTRPPSSNNYVGPSMTNYTSGTGGQPGRYTTSGSAWSMVNDPTVGDGVTKYFNSQTGETYYDYPKVDINAYKNYRPTHKGPDTGESFWWLNNLGSALAAQKNQGSPTTEWEDWEGSEYEAPAGWVAPETAIPEAGVDTRAIVESRRHRLDEEMGGQMSASAARLGAGGMLAGSEYANELGQAERARDNDLAALYYQYDYDAAQKDADRMSAARENMLNRDLSAWGTHGGWEHEGGMAGQDRDFQAWLQENLFNERSDARNADDQTARLRDLLPLLAAGGGQIQNWSAWL